MAECRSCHAPIRWVETEKGKPMPLDPEPVSDGNVVLSFSDARRGDVAHVLGPADRPADDVARYKSHFATCPNAGQHRRR